MKHSMKANIQIDVIHPRKNIIVSTAFPDVILTNVPVETRHSLAHFGGYRKEVKVNLRVNGIECILRSTSTNGDVLVHARKSQHRFLIKPEGKRPSGKRNRLNEALNGSAPVKEKRR